MQVGAYDGERDAVGAPVPPRVRASWERSQSYGIPVDAVEPTFTGTRSPGSLFHECGDAVLADLHRSMTTEPVGMMLTDAHGVVITRLSGDRALLRALDAVHLAPGFGYSEREVGTNGLGLALADHAPTRPRRSLFRVDHGLGRATENLGSDWTATVTATRAALIAGRVVAVVGEPGTGRATAAEIAARRAWPDHRVLTAGAPDPDDAESWLSLWDFEAGRADTVVVVRDVDALPTYVADRLAAVLLTGPGATMPVVVTAENLAAIPAAFTTAITAAVPLSPLRERPGDVAPLAHRIAHGVRGRDVAFTAAAIRVLQQFSWPQNCAHLRRVVEDVVRRVDVVDVPALPAELVVDSGGRRLSTIEAFERREIVRVLADGATMAAAAERLGMSRATLYRKIKYYRIPAR
ncbi:helix-turn-helix domain-containing protein [Rhodococcus kroppenstedtii]|uniref:helix-turn-helix domain-containing protein n=1 Tax=Rhodococcoides kroppenstedtii TaxID=293050 RepID=UPI002954C609|nr:helix-turn-helix domain-containing protein [Rhodococcus kroppenstedtii]MDV7196719.1 helix-turn-helix domain-containing protein [Rhodococcus kroppenstedtii]